MHGLEPSLLGNGDFRRPIGEHAILTDDAGDFVRRHKPLLQQFTDSRAGEIVQLYEDIGMLQCGHAAGIEQFAFKALDVADDQRSTARRGDRLAEQRRRAIASQFDAR